MGFIEKFHYLEPAFVYVEVNVPFSEIGSDQTPDLFYPKPSLRDTLLIAYILLSTLTTRKPTLA